MTPLTIECEVRFECRGRGRQRLMKIGPEPDSPPVEGRIPRVDRLMALAIRYDGMLRDRVVESYTEIAHLGHVTVARMSQIMSLLNLAPDIQEALLHLPRTEIGRDPIILADLLPIAGTYDWRKQRRLWRELTTGKPE